MKKFTGILGAALALSLTLTACGGGDAAPEATKAPEAAPTQAPAVEATKAPEAAPEAATPAAPGEFDGKLHGPYLVTTCGQSPGAVMINMVAMQNGLQSTSENVLNADYDFSGINTLIVTTGTSMKGMGSAGTDVNVEIERNTATIKAAKEAGLTIVGAHVEGMARRADNADQQSIDAVLALSDIVVCTEDSDSDGFFTNYANEHGLPLIKVKDSLALADVME